MSFFLAVALLFVFLTERFLEMLNLLLSLSFLLENKFDNIAGNINISNAIRKIKNIISTVIIF